VGESPHSTAPINEAVNLIASVDKAALDDLKARFPALDLRPGIEAGEAEEEDSRSFLEDKASIISKAADVVEMMATQESAKLRRKIKTSGGIRFAVQIVTILSSASVLGTLIANQNTLATVTAGVTTVVAILGVFADRYEQLLAKGRGNIFDAYDNLTQLLVDLRETRTTLELSVRHQRPVSELDNLITKANQTLEKINLLIPQL
jgi:hypothetical protein